MGTNIAQESEQGFSGSRTNSWEKNPLKAIIYDPSSHSLSTEYLSTLDSQFCQVTTLFPQLNFQTETDNFEVHLPWWRNTVDIYVDAAARSGFVATVRLDKLGAKKNWQRRLKHNYTVLRVKGPKPDKREY